MAFKSRSDEHERSVKNYDCKKSGIAKHFWEADHNFSWGQKKVVDRESRFIPRKIKETTHLLRNPNHVYKMSYRFLKFGFVIYGSSYLLIYITTVDSN